MNNPKMWSRLATASTKVIHSRACVLGSVLINKPTASAVLTIYNNTAGSGDTVAALDCASTGLSRQLDYNVSCPNGLTIVLSGGNADVTVTSEGPGV
jgi:hypothetical protein